MDSTRDRVGGSRRAGSSSGRAPGSCGNFPSLRARPRPTRSGANFADGAASGRGPAPRPPAETPSAPAPAPRPPCVPRARPELGGPRRDPSASPAAPPPAPPPPAATLPRAAAGPSGRPGARAALPSPWWPWRADLPPALGPGRSAPLPRRGYRPQAAGRKRGRRRRQLRLGPGAAAAPPRPRVSALGDSSRRPAPPVPETPRLRGPRPRRPSLPSTAACAARPAEARPVPWAGPASSPTFRPRPEPPPRAAPPAPFVAGLGAASPERRPGSGRIMVPPPTASRLAAPPWGRWTGVRDTLMRERLPGSRVPSGPSAGHRD